MPVQSSGSDEWARAATLAVVVLVALLAVTSVIAMPTIAGEPGGEELATLRTGGDESAGDAVELRSLAAGGKAPAVGETLAARVDEAAPGETVRALVLLEEQPDVADARAKSSSRDELVRTLDEQVRRSQAPVVAHVEALRTDGDVTTYRRHWLVNAVSVEATPEGVRELSSTPGVATVVADVEMSVATGEVQPAIAQESPTNGSSDRVVDGSGGNATITVDDGIDPTASAPRALDADEAVDLPAEYAVPETLDGLDVEGSSAPDPIAGEPSEDVPDAASAPFDDDGIAWGVEKVHADAANEAGYDGSNVTVAVVDTGIDDSHPDLDDRVVGWRDFVNGFENPYDDAGHGTHVAGTVAGTGEAGLQAGVAPGADLLGVKVLGEGGGGLLSNVIAGMEWAIRNDADVISLSLGGPHDPLFHAATERAVEAGVVPVVAAGNVGGSRDPFTVDLPNLLAVTDPGHSRSAVTVGATHWQDRVAWFSAHETLEDEGDEYVKPDIVAPGQDVASATAGTDEHAQLSGTSMATPHVSGIAALILQADPSAEPEDVRSLLEETAVDLGESGPDEVYGAGRVDASAALAAAGEESDLALDVETDGNETAVVATLTDASGDPVAGENVSLTAVYGPGSTLETNKVDADLYAFDGTETTDENGTVEVARPDLAANASQSGTFVVEAEASGGLARNATTVDLGDDLAVTVTARNDSTVRNGDDVVFDVEARDADGDPANVTTDVVLHGPTNHRFPNWTRTVTTGPDGNATVVVELPDDLLELYQGVGPEEGGPSFGQYGVTTVVRDENDTLRDIEVHDGIVDVEPRWTDLEFAGPETPLTITEDVETWQGEVTVGERVDASLETTEPNADYRIVLADFSGNDSGEGPTVEPVANVTTDEDGAAAFDVDLPSSLPGGYYAVLALREGQTIDDPGPIGAYDVGYVYVRALETAVNVESREDADNQAFQPGESVRITVETRDAGTGERVDPQDLSLVLSGYTDVTAAQRTGPGTIEANARFLPDGSPTGVVRVGGLDQNGGEFENHAETAVARPFTVDVEPDAEQYEPGENATLDVRVADSETGEAVSNADVRAVVTGATSDGSWTVNETVSTDDDGTASITVEVPADAVGIDYLATDALVRLTSIQKGAHTGFTTTGFDLDTGQGPSISVSQSGAEEVGLFGVNDVATYEPGERIAFEIETSGFDSEVVDGHARPVDVLAVKYSKVGDGEFVFDAEESETAVVPLDDDGRATYEFELSDDADPGLVVPIVSARINGVTLTDSQLGIVGASPVNVTTNRSTVAPGEEIEFAVDEDLPATADVDFVVKRAGSNAQFPVASVDGEADPELAPVLSQRDRSLTRTEPLASEVVDRLPERFGDREPIRRALQEALVPAMSASIAESAAGGAIDAGTASSDRVSEDSSTVEHTFVVPENAPAGTYRAVAIVHSDDGSVKERIGFAEFEVED